MERMLVFPDSDLPRRRILLRANMGIRDLPFNPIQLVVQVAKQLEHRLNAFGLGGGNGIFEKTASSRLDPLVKQKIHFISRTRNGMVHGSGANFRTFDRQAFIDASQQVNAYFDKLEEITKRPDFYSQFHQQNGQLGKKSVIDFAEELRQKANVRGEEHE
jgi:hypothetical protein